MGALDDFSGNGLNLGVIEEIKELRQKGGDVMVSIGGASGLSLAQFHSKNGKSPSQLAAAYARVVDTLKLGIVDFDIEGKTLEDAGAMELHSSAVVDLQKTHPELRIWYTLPVFPQGLTSKGIEAVRKALEMKVRLSGINIMAMDYNDELAPPKLKSMGAYAIDAANASHKQLSALFASYGKSFDWKNLGVTPMIGVNDVKSEVFYLSDAKILTDFASERRLGMLSMWSLGRDRPSEAIGEVSPVHSGINAASGSFSRIFSGYGAPIFKNQESGKRGDCE
jgi:chitinase